MQITYPILEQNFFQKILKTYQKVKIHSSFPSFRNTGLGLAHNILYGGSFFVMTSFPYIFNNLGKSSPFFLFGGGSFCLCILIFFKLPETKGKTGEELEIFFEGQ